MELAQLPRCCSFPEVGMNEQKAYPYIADKEDRLTLWTFSLFPNLYPHQ